MKLSIIGCGYVGLVTGGCLASLGHKVICVDIQQEKIDVINQGKATFYEPKLDSIIEKHIDSKRLSATSDLNKAVLETDVTFIAVSTPSKGDEIDLSQIRKVSSDIGKSLKNKNSRHTVIVKSTVVPGTTEDIVRKEIEHHIGKHSDKLGIGSNPEFLRQGSAVDDFLDPDRIIIGHSSTKTKETMLEIYKQLECPKITTSINNAEMIKYASNSLLATMISFSNEIANLCEEINECDAYTVLKGVHLDRRLSPKIKNQVITPGILNYLKAGCGFGGACLPKDVKALKYYGEQKQIKVPLLNAVLSINHNRPIKLVELAEKALGTLDNKHVVLLGIAFKEGTDDLRDSPAITIINELLKRNANITAWDPKVSNYRVVTIVSSIEEALNNADCAIITTNYKEITSLDWKVSVANMKTPVIIDGRNILKDTSLPDSAIYITVGETRNVK